MFCCCYFRIQLRKIAPIDLPMSASQFCSCLLKRAYSVLIYYSGWFCMLYITCLHSIGQKVEVYLLIYAFDIRHPSICIRK